MDKNERIVFMVAPDDSGAIVLMIGMSQPAFNHMKTTGKSHDLDLSGLGLPIKIIIFGGQDTHEEVMIPIEQYSEQNNVPLKRMDTDFSIKPYKKDRH